MSNFLQNLPKNAHFVAGLVSLDVVGHSGWEGSDKEKASTKQALEHLILEQLNTEEAFLSSWGGDGGLVIFDVSKGCDNLLLFADRIRALMPYFNRSSKVLNHLPHRQSIILRIVCHAGNLYNKNGDPGQLHADALNLLSKKEREIGAPGAVIITWSIYRNLSIELRERCKQIGDHLEFEKYYGLEHNVSQAQVIDNDRTSATLKQWISDIQSAKEIKLLRYFAYTNELLFSFLLYDLVNIDIKIVARNWVIEKLDEERHNNKLYQSGNLITRPWVKSQKIRTTAEEIRGKADRYGKSIEIRFYDRPPLFNGALIETADGTNYAFVGTSKWLAFPGEGGSAYQLEEWPSLMLDGRDPVHGKFIQNLESRFDELWLQGKSYDEIKADDLKSDKFWASDDKPYLIIFPQRSGPARKMPNVHFEDAMSFTNIQDFLVQRGNSTKLLGVTIPHEVTTDEWFPAEIEREIEQWPGHVVYTCNKAISPKTWQWLKDAGIPFRIEGVGTTKPFISHASKKDVSVSSPMDATNPETRDYSIVSRFSRPGNSGGRGFLIAGLRGVGTLGASNFVTNPEKLALFALKNDEEQFAAVIESTFDTSKYQLLDYSIHLAPASFVNLEAKI